MSGNDDLHHDRGDGTCRVCYEEWPCLKSQGKVDHIPLHQMGWEYRRQRYDEELKVKEAQTLIINEALELAGVSFRWRHPGASGVSVTFEEMAEIATALLANRAEFE